VGLAEAISLNVVFSEAVNLSNIKPATFIGTGSVERIGGLVKGLDADLVIMDCRLSPMQQRNLEKVWNTKVIDRTALILEIFGERASTREGVLQVELAHLSYQKSRLVKSWTHLERQRGGAGFLGGPGEKQIEMDRRIIGEKIIKLKKDLESVKRTRGLHRKARSRVPYPVIALVGYTNAGKSTLFNHITGAGVLAKDQLFATLDTTMRQILLPSGSHAILSDTVGFISELPTELVAAFRATLEEVLEADVIIHVRDCVHPDSAAQKEDVLQVLKGLGIGDKIERSMIEVLNKVDLLDPDTRSGLLSSSKRKNKIVAVSAVTGEGLPRLLELIEEYLGRSKIDFTVKMNSSDGAKISWLYRHADVVKRKDDDLFSTFYVRMEKSDVERLKSMLKETSGDRKNA
jgi:GTP-binding protein HflX